MEKNKLMRKIFFFLLLLNSEFFILNCLAQTKLPIDESTKLITYSATVKSDKSSKEELLARAKRWYDKTYRNSSSAKYEMDYGKNELRISKVAFGIDNDDSFVFYTLKISCADNEYTYFFSNFYHESYKGNGGALENETPVCGTCFNKKAWERAKYQTELNVRMFISVLESAMEKK